MGSMKNLRSKILKRNTFGQLIPVVEFWDEDGVFILDEPALGAMLICQPTPGTNEQTRNGLESFYKNSFPKDTTIQMQLVSMPDIENVLYGYDQIRGGRMQNSDKEQVSTLANSIRDFYREGADSNINDNGYRFKNFEFWVTIKIPINKAIPTDKELVDFKKYMRSAMNDLSFLSPFIADEFHYKRRMNVMLNMYGSGHWKGKAHHEDKVFIDKPLSEMILDEGKWAEPTNTGVQIFEDDGTPCQFIKPMSIVEMPEKMRYGSMINLLGDWQRGTELLDEHFILNLTVIYPDQKTARSNFQKRRGVITNQSRGSILQYLDKLKFQKRDFDSINRELDQVGSTLMRYHLQMLIFSKDEESANDFADKVKGMYGRNQIKIKHDNYFSLPFVMGGLPFGADPIYVKNSYRFQQATSRAMPFLTPHIGSWKGNTINPTILLGSRFGQVVGLDFFESETNYNIYCAATSGAGKSFFVGYLTNSILGVGSKKQNDARNPEVFDDGSQVFIVDVGRSYEGIANQYEGAQFLSFGKDFKYSLNPFASVDEWDGTEGAAPLVHSIILAMSCPDGKVSNLQRALLHEVLSLVWRNKGNGGSIDDVRDGCIDTEEPEMILMGKCLRPFCEGGLYGNYFSANYPPVRFDGRLIVCELEELKSDTHLQVCALMALIMNIQYKMYISDANDTPRRRMFILDEAWEYLKEDDSTGANMMVFFAKFLETGWRRFRKYGASGAMVTQSVMDAYESSVGRAIISNSAWMLLMKQTAEAVTRLESEKTFDGSKTDFELLKSLKTVSPKPEFTDEAYSEVLVRHSGDSQVCRLYTDRKFQLILTTNKDEKNTRKSYMDNELNLNDAIDAMISDEKKHNKRL